MAISLTSIRESIDAKYAPTPVELGDGKIVNLLNPMRLEDAKLERLDEILGALRSNKGDEDDEDGETKATVSVAETVSYIREVLSLAAETEAGGKLLLDAIGHDRPVLMEVLSGYLDGESVGEASPSDD